jgi:hypothetical protein
LEVGFLCPTLAADYAKECNMIEILLGRNRFTIYVPMKFIVGYEPISLGEALWACRRGIINHQAIVELAATRIGTDPGPQQTLIDLSQLRQENETVIEELAEHVAGREKLAKEKQVEAKWLRITLAWLIANWREFSDPVGVLENVVSEFDYPDALEAINRAVAGAAGSPNGFDSDAFLALLKQHFVDQRFPLPSPD